MSEKEVFLNEKGITVYPQWVGKKIIFLKRNRKNKVFIQVKVEHLKNKTEISESLLIDGDKLWT